MEKIDLVYILGGGSRWNNNEIRYSLRSVESFFPAAGKVFVIGECPEWLQNVVHIKVTDTHDNKILNAMVKYGIAVDDPRVSKDFILMNDDFFFLKSTEEIPYYSRGTIAEMLNLHPSKNGYYFRSLWDTRKRLDAMGISDAIDFEVHAPMIFNKEKLKTVMGMVGTERAYAFRSCYGNLMGMTPEKTVDFKAANTTEFLVQKLRTDSHFLSINDALVADEDFRNWVGTMYWRKSKYELDEGGLKIPPGRPIGLRKYHARKEFRFSSKLIHKGDLIPKEIIDEIKSNPAMADCWKWD